MINKKLLTLEDKINLLSGESGQKVLDKFNLKYFNMKDGPHGVKIAKKSYPNMCLVACSWNREILFKMGTEIAKDCINNGIDILLGPSVNIKRTPLCGRNFEYISEDAILAGELASAYINGLQKEGVSACVKHFCCYNQEKNRFTHNVIIDKKTLMEAYVKVFEIIIKNSNPDVLMTSYNRINGKLASESKFLIKDILREKLKYNGLIITDWGGINYRTNGIMAGTNIDMPGDLDTTYIDVNNQIEKNEELVNNIDNSVDYVLKLLEKTNDLKKTFKNNLYDEMLKFATESIVMLKNDNVLPINKDENVVIIGALAKTPIIQGGGCAFVDSLLVSQPLSEISKEFGQNLEYSQGYSIETYEKDEKLYDEAIKLAKNSKKIIFFAGANATNESEGYDRENLFLPKNQVDLINDISKINKNIIVVLSNGSAVSFCEWIDNVKGVLECYYCGDVFGKAVAQILMGIKNPSGRLAETMPVKLEDTPSYTNYIDEEDNILYGEGIFIGYKYYSSKKIAVSFPFGFGLSYSSFKYNNFKISTNKILYDDVIVGVDITNTSDIDGSEVVEIYLQNFENICRPSITLMAFDKIFLKAGETKNVKILIENDKFKIYNIKKDKFILNEGSFCLSINKNANEIIVSEKIEILKDLEKFICDRYTKIIDLINVGNGALLVEKYLLKYISKAIMDVTDYKMSFEGKELVCDNFVKNVAYSMPLSTLTTLTKGLLSNDKLEQIIKKINDELEQ